MQRKTIFLALAVIALGSFSRCSPARQLPVTTPTELQTLIEKLSGSADTATTGLPGTIAERFSDNPAYTQTVAFLRLQYAQYGIQTNVLTYNPMDVFPYYKQDIEKTYRTYFQHMIPMFTSDFNGLCDGTLDTANREKVLARLKRVNLDEAAICAKSANQRVEFYISTSIEFTVGKTKTQLETRNRPTWENVMAVIPTGPSGGEAGPRPLCVLGAHLDSIVREGGGRGPVILPVTLAPGADDNASGTVGVFVLARSLQAWIQSERPSLDCDLAFVHFSGEEEGLFGSMAFVYQQVKAPVMWMVNFDMIAYNGDPITHASGKDFVYNVGYHAQYPTKLLDAFRTAETTRAKPVIVEQTDYLYSSDQISFWGAGIPALSVSEQACAEEKCTESYKYFNPHFHTPNDTADKLDYAYMAALLDHSERAIKSALSAKAR